MLRRRPTPITVLLLATAAATSVVSCGADEPTVVTAVGVNELAIAEVAYDASPDGQWLASRGDENRVCLTPVTSLDPGGLTGASDPAPEGQVCSDPDAGDEFTWSPDSTRVAIGHNYAATLRTGRVTVLDTEGLQTVVSPEPGEDVGFWGARWIDNDRITFAALIRGSGFNSTQWWVTDLEGNAEVVVDASDPENDVSLFSQWFSSGERAVGFMRTGDAEPVLHVFDLGDGSSTIVESDLFAGDRDFGLMGLSGEWAVVFDEEFFARGFADTPVLHLVNTTTGESVPLDFGPLDDLERPRIFDVVLSPGEANLALLTSSLGTGEYQLHVVSTAAVIEAGGLPGVEVSTQVLGNDVAPPTSFDRSFAFLRWADPEVLLVEAGDTLYRVELEASA